MPRKICLSAGLVTLLLVGLLASGCGGSSKKAATTASTSAGTTTTPTVDSTVAAEVPSAIKSKGTLTVAADATYAPNEFIGSNGKSVEGMDPDLAKALAAVMGLKVKVVNASFDGIIPGLASGKYDLGMSSFTDTKERQKTVDFVTYFSAGTSFYVKAQGGPTINTLADLCGHSVGVERGRRRRPTRPRRTQSARPRASPASRCLSSRTRTPRTWQSRAAERRWAWPTRRSLHTSSSSRTVSSS